MKARHIIWIILVSIIALLIAREFASAQTNLVQEPSIETIDNWIFYEYGAEQSNTYAHTGTYSGSVWGFKGGLGVPNASGYFEQEIQNVPAGTYTLSEWIKYKTYSSRSSKLYVQACMYNDPRGEAPMPLDPCLYHWTTLRTLTLNANTDFIEYSDEFIMDADYDHLVIRYQYYNTTFWSANIPKWYIDDVNIPALETGGVMHWLIPTVFGKTTNCSYTATTVACFDDATSSPTLINSTGIDLGLAFILFFITFFGLLTMFRKGVNT